MAHWDQPAADRGRQTLPSASLVGSDRQDRASRCAELEESLNLRETTSCLGVGSGPRVLRSHKASSHPHNVCSFVSTC